MDTFNKQPAESIDYTLDFSEALNTGDALALESPTVTLGLMTGIGEVPTVEAVTVNTALSCVKVRVAGGVSGQVCALNCVVNTVTGERLEGDARIKIKEIR